MRIIFPASKSATATGERDEYTTLPALPEMDSPLYLVLVFVLIPILAACGSSPVRSGTASVPALRVLPTPAGKGIPSSTPTDHNATGTIANGIVYVGTAENALVALRQQDGSLLWRTRIDGTIEEPPAVDHGTIYVSAIASQSSLSAIRASDGHILWRSRHTGYLYAPVIEHGIVYLSTQEDGISAVRANDGMLLWHRDATLHQAPILKHGILFVSGVIFKSGEQVNHPDALYALHAPDGKQLWYHQTTTMQGSMFTVENDIVYAYMDGTCVALQVNSGREIWHQTINATFALLPQVSGGVVYLAVTTIILPNPTTSRGNGPLQQMSAQGLLQGHVQANTEREARPLKLGRSSVYALGASDGKLLWHKAVNQSNEGFLNWLQVVQDTVYFGAGMSSQNTTNGIISALNRQNGAVLWQDAAPGLSSGALLSGNVLYVSINDSPRSLLYALQAHDGTPVWSIPVSGEIYDAPTLVETTLYLGASNEIMYAFRSSNGDEVWHYDASTNA